MTTTRERRLERIEEALHPLEAFFVWLDDAHEHPSLVAWPARWRTPRSRRGRSRTWWPRPRPP